MNASQLTLRLCIVLAAALLFAAACAERQTSAPLSAADGAQLTFKRNCAVCHGANGEGQQLGASLVPSLRDGRAAADTDERLRNQILHGGGGMPPFEMQLSRVEVDALVRYIRDDLQKQTKQGE